MMIEKPHVTKVFSTYNKSTWIGTGSLVSPSGYILTCAHVILDIPFQDSVDPGVDCQIEIQFAIVKTEQKLSAKLVKWIPTRQGDLALLKVEESLVPLEAQPIRFLTGIGEKVEKEDYPFDIFGYPDETGNSYNQANGSLTGLIPPFEHFFVEPQIQKIHKVGFSSKVFKGYSGAAIQVEGYGYMGMFSFFTQNSQDTGYCISGSCIHRLFGAEIGEEIKEEGVAEVLIISPSYKSPFQAEMDDILGMEEISPTSSFEYNLSFRVFEDPEGEVAMEQLKKAYEAADMVLFEITKEERCQKLWKKYAGFACLGSCISKEQKEIIFVDWDAGKEKTTRYAKIFHDALENSKPGIKSLIPKDYTKWKKFPDGILAKFISSCSSLKSKYPELSYETFKGMLDEIHLRLSHPVDPSEFENSLLYFDFRKLKLKFDRLIKKEVKFALIGIEGSKDCALELLVKNLLRERLTRSTQALKPISFQKSEIKTVEDLWQEVAMQLLGISKNSPISVVTAKLLQKLEGDRDMVILLMDLFVKEPTIEESQNMNTLLKGFWAQLVGGIKQKNPRNRLFVFALNKFYNHQDKTGRIDLKLVEDANTQIFSLPPTDQFKEEEVAMTVKEWSKPWLRNYSKKEREKIDKNIGRLAVHTFTRPLLQELCDMYHPESFEYIERI